MGKKDEQSSLYNCGGKGAVGLELKASGLQGECSTHGLAVSLNWKKEIENRTWERNMKRTLNCLMAAGMWI